MIEEKMPKPVAVSDQALSLFGPLQLAALKKIARTGAEMAKFSSL